MGRSHFRKKEYWTCPKFPIFITHHLNLHKYSQLKKKRLCKHIHRESFSLLPPPHWLQPTQCNIWTLISRKILDTIIIRSDISSAIFFSFVRHPHRSWLECLHQRILFFRERVKNQAFMRHKRIHCHVRVTTGKNGQGRWTFHPHT